MGVTNKFLSRPSTKIIFFRKKIESKSECSYLFWHLISEYAG